MGSGNLVERDENDWSVDHRSTLRARGDFDGDFDVDFIDFLVISQTFGLLG